VTVRGDIHDAAFARAAKGALGVALPHTPNTVVPFAHGVALWQGPDEWLLVCARTAKQDCIAGLEAALQGLHAQVVDNSGGLTMVYLTGEQQVTLLRHVGVYDFEALRPGHLASTVAGKAAITVFRHDDDGIFLVFRRSFADYLWRLLSKAARPYGLGIVSLESRTPHPVLRLA
jgi:sarcosine oxidase subunit gamma